MATGTGWTFQQIDDAPLSGIFDLLYYWKGRPPVHEIAAAYFKIDPMPQRIKATSTPEAESRWWETIEDDCADQDLGAFAQMIGIK